MLGDPGLCFSPPVEIESVPDSSHGAAAIEIGEGTMHLGAVDFGNGAFGVEKGFCARKYTPQNIQGYAYLSQMASHLLR